MRKFEFKEPVTDLKVHIEQRKKGVNCYLHIEERISDKSIFVHKVIFRIDLFSLFDALQEKHKLRFALSSLELVSKTECPSAMTQALLLGLINGNWSIPKG